MHCHSDGPAPLNSSMIRNPQIILPGVAPFRTQKPMIASGGSTAASARLPWRCNRRSTAPGLKRVSPIQTPNPAASSAEFTAPKISRSSTFAKTRIQKPA